jgi:hypothetical protein
VAFRWLRPSKYYSNVFRFEYTTNNVNAFSSTKIKILHTKKLHFFFWKCQKWIYLTDLIEQSSFQKLYVAHLTRNSKTLFSQSPIEKNSSQIPYPASDKVENIITYICNIEWYNINDNMVSRLWSLCPVLNYIIVTEGNYKITKYVPGMGTKKNPTKINKEVLERPWNGPM